MDKKAFKVTSIHDNDTRDYWKTKTYIERLEALEQLRQIAFGYDPATTRLQRTLKLLNSKKIEYLADIENLQ